MFFQIVGRRIPWLTQAEAILPICIGDQSVAYPIMWSVYLDLVEKMLVSWSWILWPRLLLCSAAVADSDGCATGDP